MLASVLLAFALTAAQIKITAIIVGLILLAVCYKWVFWLFGIIFVPETKRALVTKKWVLFGTDKSLKSGQVFATGKQAGIHAELLPPGMKVGYWPWQYKIEFLDPVIVPTGKLGVVTARDGKQLPDGVFLAPYVECNDYQDAITFLDNGGYRGKQTRMLLPKTYIINTRVFDVRVVDMVVIPEGKVGIVTTQAGTPMPTGEIAGPIVGGHNRFQLVDEFTRSGGIKGLQEEVLTPGTYLIHPEFATVETVDMTLIPVGWAGVVISYVGKKGNDTSGDEFKHGNIVLEGEKGVWSTTKDPGRYAINPKTTSVVPVPTTNIVLNWADARTESHKLDQNLCTITVRSKDGFKFNLDVSQIINISNVEAPKVIARFGTIQNLVTQVLEPTIGNYFRNSAQNSDAIDFLTSRAERQMQAKEHINAVLDNYNVVGVDTLIGDINPPQDLMDTLTKRKIAEQEKITFGMQKQAQAERQAYESAKSNADMQPQIVQAERGVDIAEKIANAKVKTATGDADSKTINAKADANVRTVNAEAEATATLVVGNAKAEVTSKVGTAEAEVAKKKVDAMGEQNYAGVLKVQYFSEAIKSGNVAIVPKILVNSGNDGNGGTGDLVTALLGAKALESMVDDTVEIADVKEKKSSK